MRTSLAKLQFLTALCSALSIVTVGCYAPLHSPGIAARELPDQFRWPLRTSAAPLNYSHLVAETPPAYLLGTGDKLQITAPDLIAQGHSEPFQVQVLDQGEIYIPRLGPVAVGGLTLGQAQQKINEALGGGLLNNPNTVLTLIEKGTVNVLVLGAVQTPGVHSLPRFENDVAHALAAAQGFSEDAGDVIEIHRRGCLPSGPTRMREFSQASPVSTIPNLSLRPQLPDSGTPVQFTAHTLSNAGHNGHSLTGIPVGGVIATPNWVRQENLLRPRSSQQAIQGNANSSIAPAGYSLPTAPVIRGQSPMIDQMGCGESFVDCEASPIVRIPLRGSTAFLNSGDVVLNPGDVLVIPRKTDKVFYVVGPLSEQNRLRFSVGDKDRQIGNGLLLPENREIDVVTAVAMAGYIDPIESPTTVTVHRVMPDRRPLLIRVDLIAARSDPQETVMIQPGDIIYLNPDAWWYGRRTMDRVVERALGTAVGRWLTN